MQEKKHEGLAVFMYFAVLLLIVIINLINNESLFDLIYLFVILCCVFKFFLIIRKEKG